MEFFTNRCVRSLLSISEKSGKDALVRITWENPDQMSRFVSKLRSEAEKLKTENFKLRRLHSTIQQIVYSLMNTDLLRDFQKWKDQIQEIKKIMEHLTTSEGYSSENMRSWKAFWDRQIYKALEIQYQIGLRAFNDNLREIHLDLTFTDNVLHYKLSNSTSNESSFEQIKDSYFEAMKNFVMIPLNFRGCRETSSNKKLIFQSLFFRYSNDIASCYGSSNGLFRRLENGLSQFQEWTILSQVDIEELIETFLNNVQDWEKNLRILKLRSQEVEKLPKSVGETSIFL